MTPVEIAIQLTHIKSYMAELTLMLAIHIHVISLVCAVGGYVALRKRKKDLFWADVTYGGVVVATFTMCIIVFLLFIGVPIKIF